MRFYLYFILAFVLQACAQKPVSFEKASFDDVGGADFVKEEQFQTIFERNCTFLSKPSKREMNPIFGSQQKWRQVCNQSKNTQNYYSFFINNFDVYKVKSKEKGLFTGYYAPFYEGSLNQTAKYKYPLFQKPRDIYKFNLSDLGVEVDQKSFMVRVDEKTKTIQRYYDRKNIEKGDVEPIVWLKSSIDAFFLSIQGSGFIKLPDGDTFHASFAGSNGHNYRAIGRDLIERGYLKREEISMQSIRTFLEKNPDKVESILNLNPRYIFFTKGDGQVKGSLGVGLTANKSLAVDPKYIPLGMPVFVKTEKSYNNKPFKTWMFAEDTGAAIKGGLRGDIYFGQGELAGKYAGSQNANGDMYVIVPK